MAKAGEGLDKMKDKQWGPLIFGGDGLRIRWYGIVYLFYGHDEYNNFSDDPCAVAAAAWYTKQTANSNTP